MNLPVKRSQPDIETMREGARRLLDEHTELPDRDELDTYLLAVRGQLMLMIPEVETRAHAIPDGPAHATALESIVEARHHLDTEPTTTLPGRIAHAQRLACSMLVLCRHYEALA